MSKPEGAGKTETADSRNASMKSIPDGCGKLNGGGPATDSIIQKCQPIGDKAAPAVRD